MEDAVRDEHLFIDIVRRVQMCEQRIDKVPHDNRRIGDARNRPGRNDAHAGDLEVAVQVAFRRFLGFHIVIEDMKRVVIRVFRIDPVACEASAETVGTVVHDADRIDRRLTVDAAPSETVYDPAYRASRRDPDFSFFF